MRVHSGPLAQATPSILHSDRRADAVVLEALIADQPANDLIPKIVRGLLGHRTQGRWSSTQENVFVLLALDRYFKTYEKVTPDFVARVWLGNAYTGGAHGFTWWQWRRTWFDHQNLRDERSEAFTTLLWGGVYNYSYVARATTPGVFVVPPAKAEEMYHPETFGRSKSDRVRVE